MQDSFEYRQSVVKRRFEEYDGKMVLKSSDAKTQAIFNKVLSVFDKNKNGQLDADEIKTIWDNLIVADKDQDKEITTDEINTILKQNNILSKLKMSPEDIIKFIKIVHNTISKSFQKRLTNTSATLMKSYKKKYPENKYKYEYKYNNILGDTGNFVITNKTTGEVMLTCSCSVDGSYIIYKNNKTVNYDKNGNIILVSTFDEKTKLLSSTHNPISDNLYKDITAKNKLGLPTTGKNFEKHIKQINSENILSVLENYQENYGESLLDAINGEWGLDKNIKASAIKHLNNCLINSKVWKDNKPNTKIDNNFSQGQIGDCWLLSTISAIQRSPKGQAILNNIIKDNKDGTYTVKFKGADKAYTVSALELYANGNFSKGDIDVRILELAAEKYYNILGIDGGNPRSAFDLLLGKQRDGLNATSPYGSKPNPQNIKKLLNNKNVVMTCCVNPFSKLWGLIVKSVPENAVYKKDIATAHAYAVYDIDDKNIYLKNPWDTSKIVAIPLDVFDEYWANVQYTEIR